MGGVGLSGPIHVSQGWYVYTRVCQGLPNRKRGGSKDGCGMNPSPLSQRTNYWESDHQVSAFLSLEMARSVYLDEEALELNTRDFQRTATLIYICMQ